jgi:hypothetical protein
LNASSGKIASSSATRRQTSHLESPAKTASVANMSSDGAPNARKLSEKQGRTLAPRQRLGIVLQLRSDVAPVDLRRNGIIAHSRGSPRRDATLFAQLADQIANSVSHG